MTYQRKTYDVYVIYYKYPGLAWEEVCEYSLDGDGTNFRTLAKADIKEYRLSGTEGQYKLVKERRAL